VCTRPQFSDFVLIVTRPFRRHARDNPVVLEQLVAGLRRVGAATAHADDLATVVAQVGIIEETVRRASFESTDDVTLAAAISGATRGLGSLSHTRHVNRSDDRSR
jgi:hypothetical protein